MISYYQVLTLTALHTDVVAALDQERDKTSDNLKIYILCVSQNSGINEPHKYKKMPYNFIKGLYSEFYIF